MAAAETSAGEVNSLAENNGATHHYVTLKDSSREFLLVLADSYGSSSCSQTLRLRRCLRKIPSLIGGRLRKLQECDLTKCDLKSLSATLEELLNLQVLYIRGCKIAGLPDSIGSCKSLQILRLHGCRKLGTLPTTIGQLQNLQQLEIVMCQNLTALPDSIGDLASLQTLRLRNCPELSTLPTAIGGLKNLKQFEIEAIQAISMLPDSIGSLASLQELTLECGNLQALPATIGMLKNLLVLNVRRCHHLMELPQELGNMLNLKKISLVGCGIHTWENIIRIPLPPRLREFDKGACPQLHDNNPTSSDILSGFLTKNPYVMSLGQHGLSLKVEQLLALNQFRKFLPGGDYSITPEEFSLVLELINTKLQKTTSANVSVLYSLLRTQSEWWV